MPFGPSVAPPPPSRTGRPSVAPPPPSRTGNRSASGRPLPPPSRASIPDIEAPAPSSPSQISATDIASVPSNAVPEAVAAAPGAAAPLAAPVEATTGPSNSSVATAPNPPSNTGLGIPRSEPIQQPPFQHAAFNASDLVAPARSHMPPARGLGSRPEAAAPAFADSPSHSEAGFSESRAFSESPAFSESQSAPGTPPLDHVFATEDEPESQDGSVLSAGRVLSQPVDRASVDRASVASVDRPSVDPSTPFTDDDEDEATRVLDHRETGLSRRVNSALKSSLRNSVAPPPPPGLGSRPSTTHPPMSVHPVRPPSAMPPPSAPMMGFPSRIPPAAPAPGSTPFQPSTYEPPSAPAFAHLTVPPKNPQEKSKWPVLALAAGIVAASVTWFVLGSAGSLLVTVSGPGNTSVKDVKSVRQRH